MKRDLIGHRAAGLRSVFFRHKPSMIRRDKNQHAEMSNREQTCDGVHPMMGFPDEKQPAEMDGPRRGTTMMSENVTAFSSADFLANEGLGRAVVELKAKETFFRQGDPADCVFYLQKGRAKLTVVSQNSKQATISLLSSTDFVGEESLAAILGLRLATATAMNACTALKIERAEMIRVMHDEPAFADIFLKFLLARSMRTQADLVDQLFNSSETRLARVLLTMAEYGSPGEPETLIPPISQETLANIVGITPSQVSFFMNRFRKLGFISYNSRIQVHKSLLNVVLLDQLPEHNAQKPPILLKPLRAAKKGKAAGRKAKENQEHTF